jgi:hypothetical protein
MTTPMCNSNKQHSTNKADYNPPVFLEIIVQSTFGHKTAIHMINASGRRNSPTILSVTCSVTTRHLTTVSISKITWRHWQKHEGVRSTGRVPLKWKHQGIRLKTCPSATPSTINPIWNDLELNLDLRCERPLLVVLSKLDHGALQ